MVQKLEKLIGVNEMLLCSVGGTKTEIAHFEGGCLSPVDTVATGEFSTATELIDHALHGKKTESIRIAVAGPVSSGKSKLTNVDLEFDQSGISQAFNAHECLIVNDIVAVGVAVQSDARRHSGRVIDRGNRTMVLNVGTGFGGALIHGMDFEQVIGFEPGRFSGASLQRLSLRLRNMVHELQFHESEDILSGSGVQALYEILCETKVSVPGAHEIFARSDRGDEISQQTVRLFWSLLGGTCGELVSLLAPVRTVVFTGSVVLQNWGHRDRESFQQCFEREVGDRESNWPVSFERIEINHPELVGLSCIPAA